MKGIFPDVVLYNPYHIGDNVLIEPVANILAIGMNKIYVASNHPEVFIGHPNIIGVDIKATGVSKDVKMIDLTNALKVLDADGNIIRNKVQRIYDACGIKTGYFKPPKLYLTDDEKQIARELRQLIGGQKTCVIPYSRSQEKDWPYFDKLVKWLKKNGHHVFIGTEFEDETRPLFDKRIGFLTGLSMREFMAKLYAMDLVIANDTGTAHIALALDIPTIVIGYDTFADHYDFYDTCQLITAKTKKTLGYMQTVSIRKVTNAVKHAPKPKVRDIGIMLLEGLGGTVTMTDHAKKVYQKYGIKPVVIIRKYKELFAGNPYIADVVEVGTYDHRYIVQSMARQFDMLASIRTGVGAWYLDSGNAVEIDEEFIEIYKQHPLSIPLLERYGMNMTLLADMTLGLPHDKLEIELFNISESMPTLPSEYIAVTNGVDTWHKGLKQTKSWEHKYWEELVAILDIPVVQLGTRYDMPIKKAIDIRGATSIEEMLAVLNNAKVIVCTEGGLMHLGYAMQKPTVVLRGPTRGNFYCYPDQYHVDSYLCEKCHWTDGLWYQDCVGHHDTVCMKSITPIRVLNTLEGILNETVVSSSDYTPV